MSLLGASSLSRTEISSTVGEEGEDEEDEEEWLSSFIGVLEADEDPDHELDKPGTDVSMNFVPTFYHSSCQVSPIDRDIGR